MATNFIATNKNYKRLFASALDSSSEYETYEEMLAYIPNPTSYAGQILYCAETDLLYRIGIDTNGNKILKNDIGSSEGSILKPEQVLTVLYSYGTEFKGNLKEALDYLFEKILTDVRLTPEMVLQLGYKYNDLPFNTIGEALDYLVKKTIDIDNTCYYGVYDEKNVPKNVILRTFKKDIEISEPDIESEDTLKQTNKFIEIDFHNSDREYGYLFLAYPINKGEAISLFKECPLGFGGFEYNFENGENDDQPYNVITLPNKNGLSQEYILMRSDQILYTNKSNIWTFYFNK